MNRYDSCPTPHECTLECHLHEEQWKNREMLSASSTLASSESSVVFDVYLENCSQYDSTVRAPVGGLFPGIWLRLGFSYNPLFPVNDISRSRNSAAADMRLAMLSNFSTAYNVISISLALHLMTMTHPDRPEDKALSSSALVAGMIVGQLAGGTLGDVLGRHVAMTCVMLLQVLSAFFSALSVDCTLFGYEISIFTMLAAWRFVLGIGAGGVYPLAATITTESSQSTEESAKSVALTFSMQGVGYLVVPLVAWLMVAILRVPSEYAWRLLLGFGALPGICLTFARVCRSNRKTTVGALYDSTNEDTNLIKRTDDFEGFRTAPVSVVDAIMIEPNLVAKLIGTGGCWFLFDILFYGNTLFQPMVLSSAFGAAETIEKVALDSTIIACMALPGYVISIAATGRQSPRFIQLQGFLMMSALYSGIGYYFTSLAEFRWLLLLLYSLTFFWSNYGPNTTTFMLPSMTFSKPCRATLNGISAAFGKLGALLGTTVFVPLAVRFGERWIMFACALLSLVGFALTWWFVSTPLLEPNRLDERVLKQMSLSDRIKVERRVNKVAMKVVYSKPSLFDLNDDPEEN